MAVAPSLRVRQRSLETDFLAGGWSLDRARWDLTAGEIARWTGHPLPTSRQREAFSQALQWLWNERQRLFADTTDQPFRRFVIGDAMPISILERSTDREITAIALGPSVVADWARHSGEGVTALNCIGPICRRSFITASRQESNSCVGGGEWLALGRRGRSPDGGATVGSDDDCSFSDSELWDYS